MLKKYQVFNNGEQDPLSLRIADNYIGAPGSTNLHGITQAFQAAFITQSTGVISGPATPAEESNPLSIYSRAHLAATPQLTSFASQPWADRNTGKLIRIDYTVTNKAGTLRPLINKVIK